MHEFFKKHMEVQNKIQEEYEAQRADRPPEPSKGIVAEIYMDKVDIAFDCPECRRSIEAINRTESREQRTARRACTAAQIVIAVDLVQVGSRSTPGSL